MATGPAIITNSGVSSNYDGSTYFVPSIGGKQQTLLFVGMGPIATSAAASQAIVHNTLAVTFQLITFGGVSACVCTIQGSNDVGLSNWVNLGTITVNTANSSDGFALPGAAYSFFRANVTTLTGGNCQVVVGS
jgi:hypothetical protein